jgi:hypothetical protein
MGDGEFVFLSTRVIRVYLGNTKMGNYWSYGDGKSHPRRGTHLDAKSPTLWNLYAAKPIGYYTAK